MSFAALVAFVPTVCHHRTSETNQEHRSESSESGRYRPSANASLGQHLPRSRQVNVIARVVARIGNWAVAQGVAGGVGSVLNGSGFGRAGCGARPMLLTSVAACAAVGMGTDRRVPGSVLGCGPRGGNARDTGQQSVPRGRAPLARRTGGIWRCPGSSAAAGVSQALQRRTDGRPRRTDAGMARLAQAHAAELRRDFHFAPLLVAFGPACQRRH